MTKEIQSSSKEEVNNNVVNRILGVDTFEVNWREERDHVGPGDYIIVATPSGEGYGEIKWTFSQVEGYGEQFKFKCRRWAPITVEGNEVKGADKDTFPHRLKWFRKPYDVNSQVLKPSEDIMKRFFASHGIDIGIKIGELKGYHQHIPVVLDGTEMNRHTCLLAQSGSGKSYALGLLIEYLFVNENNHAQIIIMDPNSDFKNFDELKLLHSKNDYNAKYATNSPNNQCEIINDEDDDYDKFCKELNNLKNNNKITSFSKGNGLFINFGKLDPPTRKAILNLDDRDRLDRDISLALDACGKYIEHIMIHEEKEKKENYTIKEFLNSISMLVNHLSGKDQKTVKTLEPFINLFGRLEDFIFALRGLWSRTTNLYEKRVWMEDYKEMSFINDIETHHNNLIQLDLGELKSEERGILVLKALQVLWDRNVKDSKQTFIVIDEAHNVVPSEPENLWQQLSSNMVNQIAGEGRKYGLHLVLVSQSPSKIHQNTLTQCENIIVMKITNTRELEVIKDAFGIQSEELLDSVTRFSRGRALIVGPISPCPVMIRIGRRRTKEGKEEK